MCGELPRTNTLGRVPAKMATATAVRLRWSMPYETVVATALRKPQREVFKKTELNKEEKKFDTGMYRAQSGNM